MQLSSTINKGMFQLMDRQCSSSVLTYPLKDKISDLNDALDWYAQLAFKADARWRWDDINNTSPPIDTQALVSGTNRYKVGAFTAKIINFLKLEVLDSAGKGQTLTPEFLENLDGSFETLYLNSINTGVPKYYCKYGDFIYLRPTPNYSLAAALKAYFSRAANKFLFVSCSISNATPAVVTSTGHGLVAGDTIVFEVDDAGTLNTGITADQQYYVISSGLGTDTFQFSATLGGSAVATSSTGSGVHYLKTSASPGVIELHHPALWRKASLTQLSIQTSPKLGYLPQDVLMAEKMIGAYFGRRDQDASPPRLIPAPQNNK